MLDDRYYMRRAPFEWRRSAVLILIAINVAVFFIQAALAQFNPLWYAAYKDYGALAFDGLRHGFVWQLLTYQFMHANLLHLLFNCLAIYIFGLEVENVLGKSRFLALYFSSGVIGGLVQVLAAMISYARFGGAVVGASAAGFGLVAAYAMLFPERILLLFFVLPIKAKFLLLLETALAVGGILFPQNTAPGAVRYADAAHLGGIITGVLFIRYAIHWNWHWPRFSRQNKESPRRLVRVSSGTSALWGRSKSVPAEELPPEEFLSREVDPILDKISAHGIQSLTERERRILEAAREKMGKR